MSHPIENAALAAGFIEAKAAAAHPFTLWKERLSRLPLGKYLKLEYRPEALCGWPLSETTLWAALLPAAPYIPWSEECGEITHDYLSFEQASKKEAEWSQSVQAMGYEAVASPYLPERAAAIRAGLGMHSFCGPMITQRPELGSFVCVSLLLVHMPPPAGTRDASFDSSSECERCGQCISACPASAITENGLDATKCLRFGMGHPEKLDEQGFRNMGKRIWGCDSCQRACPHNSAVSTANYPEELLAALNLENLLRNPDMGAIESWIGSYYARKEALQRQAVYAAANMRRKDLLEYIFPLTESENQPLREAALWAARQMA